MPPNPNISNSLTELSYELNKCAGNYIPSFQVVVITYQCHDITAGYADLC